MTPNRVVALFTPVFAAAAGAVATWLAENFPGLNLDPDKLEEVFIAGAVVALAPALQWLHGWQKYETREAEAAKEIAVAHALAAEGVTAEAAIDDESVYDELGLFDELDEFDEAEELEELDALMTENGG
jgi:hypothetical protein